MHTQAGGPSWEVPLGRRDSRGASLSGSNNNIPAPNNTFQTILTKFKLQGLDVVDLVALSGKLTQPMPFFELPQTINKVLKFRKNLFREPHNWKCSVHQLQAEAVQPVRKWEA
jgi:hypothetical protein